MRFLTFLFVLLSANIFAFQVFFTAPPNVGTLKPALLNLLESANSSIHIAIYSLDDEDVIRTLDTMRARGVDVELVMEGENYVKNMKNLSKFDIVADPIDNALMHEKFAVVDGRFVWIGSANFTHSSLYNDFNNAVLLDSPDLAKVLEDEFGLMRSGYFSLSQNAAVLRTEGFETEIFFSPSGGCFDGIIGNLKEAKKEVDVAIYAFSDVRVALTLMVLESRGVKVRVIADSTWNDSVYSVFPKVKEFRFFKELYNPYGLLHDKYIVVDPGTSDARVITGSYNLTVSAESKNNEIVLIIRSREIAERYLEDFESMSQN